MRLDSRHGTFDLYDVATLTKPKDVMWVDDVTARWGGLSPDPHTKRLQAMGVLEFDEHQEKRITIYMDRRLILFNEVEDGSSNETETPAQIIQEVADAARV